MPDQPIAKPDGPDADELALLGSVVFDVVGAEDSSAAAVDLPPPPPPSSEKRQRRASTPAAAFSFPSGAVQVLIDWIVQVLINWVASGAFWGFADPAGFVLDGNCLLCCKRCAHGVFILPRLSQAVGSKSRKKLAAVSDLQQRHSIMDSSVAELDQRLGEDIGKVRG